MEPTHHHTRCARLVFPRETIRRHKRAVGWMEERWMGRVAGSTAGRSECLCAAPPSACYSLRVSCVGCVIQRGSCFGRAGTCAEPERQPAKGKEPTEQRGKAPRPARRASTKRRRRSDAPRGRCPRARTRAAARTHPRAARARSSSAPAIAKRECCVARRINTRSGETHYACPARNP